MANGMMLCRVKNPGLRLARSFRDPWRQRRRRGRRSRRTSKFCPNTGKVREILNGDCRQSDQTTLRLLEQWEPSSTGLPVTLAARIGEGRWLLIGRPKVSRGGQRCCQPHSVKFSSSYVLYTLKSSLRKSGIHRIPIYRLEISNVQFYCNSKGVKKNPNG